MPSELIICISGFIIAAVSSLMITPAVIKLAHLRGWVVAPRKDRWHTKPTALMGGIGIFIAFIIGTLFSSIYVDINWVIIIAITIMFTIGIVDDLFELKPIYKLLSQVFATFIILSQGYLFGNGQLGILSVPITFFWVIGITNAINLLDNMDGLSSGIASIIAMFIGVISIFYGYTFTAALSFSLFGACLGFLRYNFNPAKIFMGDSGSLFIGFSLSFLAFSIQKGISDVSVSLVLSLPLVLMIIPILDTSLVTFKRYLSGRKIYQGGKDHSSHRLVALGLSEKKAVLILYAISILWGATGLFLLLQKERSALLPIIAILFVLTIFFGLFLGNVRVYDDSEEKQFYLRSRGYDTQKGGVVIRFLLMNKKLIFGLFFDIMIISASYYLSYGIMHLAREKVFLELGIFIFVKSMMLFLFNSYRRSWKHISTSDISPYFLAIFSSSIILLLFFSFIFSGKGHSVPFYFLDLCISFMGIISIRIFIKYLRETILRFRFFEKRALIYGAGELGVILVKHLLTDVDNSIKPVGFIDDDKSIKDVIINGIVVLGDGAEVLKLSQQTGAKIVIIASDSINSDQADRLKNDLSSQNIEVKRFSMRLMDA